METICAKTFYFPSLSGQSLIYEKVPLSHHLYCYLCFENHRLKPLNIATSWNSFQKLTFWPFSLIHLMHPSPGSSYYFLHMDKMTALISSQTPCWAPDPYFHYCQNLHLDGILPPGSLPKHQSSPPTELGTQTVFFSIFLVSVSYLI